MTDQNLQHYTRGKKYFKAGNYAAAEQELQQALAPDTTHLPIWHLWLARTHDMLGHLDSAIGSYTHALDLAGGQAMARHYAGASFANKGDFDQAYEILRRVNPLRHVRAYALLHRAHAYTHTAQLTLALADYRSYLALDPLPAHRRKIEAIIIELEAQLDAQ